MTDLPMHSLWRVLVSMIFSIAAAAPATAQYLLQTIPPTPFQANASAVISGLVGDLDTNGLPDVVYFDAITQIHVMLNPGVNGITTATTYPTTQATPLAVGGTSGGGLSDFDGDGNLDVPVLMGVGQTTQIYIWRGNGNGTLAVPPSGPLPVNDIRRIFVGDLHGDGLGDIVAHRQSPLGTGGHEIVLLSNFGGGLWVPWSRRLPSWPRSLTVGDFDGDGKLDVAWSLPYDPLVYVAYGTGMGGLQPEVLVNPGSIIGGQAVYGGVSAPYLLASPHYALASPDVDGDGRDDLLVALAYTCQGTPPSQLKLLYGSSLQGSFVDGGNILPVGNCGQVYTPLAGDWDADGVSDVIVFQRLFASGYHESRYHLMRGLGNRSFASEPMNYVIPYAPVPQAIALDPLMGDYDGDGDLDIIGAPSGYTNYLENRAYFGQGCSGVTGLPPVLSVDPPTLGNVAFGMNLFGATPSSAAVVAVSLVRELSPVPCGPLINLGSANLVLPQGSFGFVTTDVSGAARVPIPLPVNPALRGTTFFAQWAVADPMGASTAPFPGLALSQGRMIILW